MKEVSAAAAVNLNASKRSTFHRVRVSGMYFSQLRKFQKLLLVLRTVTGLIESLK